MQDIKIIVLHHSEDRQLEVTVKDNMTGQEFIEGLLDNNFMVDIKDGYCLVIEGGEEIYAYDTFVSCNVQDEARLRIIPKKNIDEFMQERNKLFFLNSKNSNSNFNIEKIELTNFKQYKFTFSMEFDSHINIIIGQNSIGKTSLLQAITLALLKENSYDLKKVDYDRYITKGQKSAEIVISYDRDEEKRVNISKNSRSVDNNYFIPFVLTYGSNFFTSKTNEVKEVARNIVNATIHQGFTDSIFMDYTSGFVNPIRLLEFLDLEKSDNVEEIQNLLIDTINKFLENFQLVAKDKDYFFYKNGMEVRLELEDLSEGYRSNVLLITDMLIKILGVGWRPKTIEGIVLIDEFDKHLHPRWQSKLVNQLQETFPKIQFIMTTHNPMSILDRDSNEITILRDTKEGIKAINKRVGTKKIGVSTILLEYFGVKSTVSKTMEDKLDAFTKLKLKDRLSLDDEKEIKELEKFLDETVATNFIYNRAYFNFLKFLKENKEIDFQSYEKMSNEDMELLLNEFKDLFE